MVRDRPCVGRQLPILHCFSTIALPSTAPGLPEHNAGFAAAQYCNAGSICFFSDHWQRIFRKNYQPQMCQGQS